MSRRPRIAISDAAEWIVISRNDIDRARHRFAFEHCEGSLGDMLRDAVIVEHVAGDQYEMDAMLDGRSAKLLDRREARLTDPVARRLIESRDAHSQMQVSGVQKLHHDAVSSCEKW